MAETNIVILVRQKIGDVLADMTSYARFLDRLERRERALGHRGARRHLRARPARSGRALGGIRPVVHGDRPSRSIRSPTATWPRVSSPPAARCAPVVYRDGSPDTAQLYARYEDWLAQHA